MKPFIYLLLIIPIVSLGQQNSKHCISVPWGETCVSLLSDNEFIYERGDCTSNWVGKGWYKLSKTRLRLYFEEDTTGKDKGGIIVEILQHDKPNSSKIVLDIIDKHIKQPIYFAQVGLIYDSSEYIGTGSGTITDTNGHATFEFNTPGKWALMISHIGYNRIKVPISFANDYKIKATLTPAISTISKGKIFTFKIKRSKDDFELIPRKTKHFRKRQRNK